MSIYEVLCMWLFCQRLQTFTQCTHTNTNTINIQTYARTILHAQIYIERHGDRESYRQQRRKPPKHTFFFGFGSRLYCFVERDRGWAGGGRGQAESRSCVRFLICDFSVMKINCRIRTKNGMACVTRIISEDKNIIQKRTRNWMKKHIKLNQFNSFDVVSFNFSLYYSL